jgi:hypothetical protein
MREAAQAGDRSERAELAQIEVGLRGRFHIYL